jgi:hypothetical protein
MQSDVTGSTQTDASTDDDVARAAVAAFAARLSVWAEQSGARVVWQAWADGMQEQNRVVDIDRQSWLGLDTRDKKLDQSIAVQFIQQAIKHTIGEGHA